MSDTMNANTNDTLEAVDMAEREDRLAPLTSESEQTSLDTGFGQVKGVLKRMSVHDLDFRQHLNIRAPHLYASRVPVKVQTLLADGGIRVPLIAVSNPEWDKPRLSNGFLRAHAVASILESDVETKKDWERIPVMIVQGDEALREKLMYDHGSEVGLSELEVYLAAKRLLRRNATEEYIAVVMCDMFKELASVADRGTFEANVRTLREHGKVILGKKAERVIDNYPKLCLDAWRGRIQRFKRIATAVPRLEELWIRHCAGEPGGLRLTFDRATAISNAASNERKKCKGENPNMPLAEVDARVAEVQNRLIDEWLAKDAAPKVSTPDAPRRWNETQIEGSRATCRSAILRNQLGAVLGDPEAVALLEAHDAELARYEAAKEKDPVALSKAIEAILNA